ncbi:saposin [Vigna unguiculata]|uniref:Pulmonary surfactant-associated protein B n=1 Tax=Vigna unguiculata TaxID=3917 RepID=A0A4D6NE47_VIGUN|nr:saposin [Vigna unguiculata]
MEGRMGLLFLVVVLGAAWACDAREVANLDQTKIYTANTEPKAKFDMCALCEEYTTKALEYIKQNKTDQEIIDTLHNTCSQLHSFKQKCIDLVDYYTPIFLSEVASLKPREFCHEINICQLVEHVSVQVQEDACGFCEETVSTLLDKLKDSDTKLEIIETLLKLCNSVEKYANKCKRLVFDYGPLVFDNAEKFLENVDFCTVIHACKSSAVASEQAFLSDS